MGFDIVQGAPKIEVFIYLIALLRITSKTRMESIPKYLREGNNLLNTHNVVRSLSPRSAWK